MGKDQGDSRPSGAHDDENIAALDTKLGTVVLGPHARRLQREPANICADAPRAPDRTADRAPDVAVVTDGHGGTRSDAYHAVPSRGAVRGSTIAS